MLIDTHVHLDAAEFDVDRAAVIAAAQAAGVVCMVVPAVAADGFAAVSDCCARYPVCVPAWGIHPLYVGAAAEADLDRLADRLAVAPAVAVGEIGLDFFREPFDAGRQEFFFLQQLRLARRFDLPVILHVRQAVDRVLKCLRQVPVRGGIAHAFNGSQQQAGQFMALGFRLGFGGAFTFPRATRLRALAQALPLEALVLETDAPDMAPVWGHPGRNTPAQLPRIAAELAGLRGISVEEVIAVTGAQARAVLSLP